MSQNQLDLSYQEPSLDRLHQDLRFVAKTVAEIANSLPNQRRPLSESTKALHVAVTNLRRNGFCPCCQRTPVCDAEGKLPGTEFDHWYGRHRNAPDETWGVCGECNRRLESAEFKTAARSAFEAYQQAVAVLLMDGQQRLF